MNSSAKKKLSILLTIALTVLFLGIFAVSAIDTSKIIKLVAAQVKATTGRDLAINGSVSIKIFPRLAVVAEDVSLSNATWAIDPAMLKAQQVAFSLQWMPLFSKRIQIDNVTISQLQLFLQSAPIDQKTSGNWTLTATSDANDNTANTDFGLDLSQIHLNQLAISYKNAAGQIIDSLAATHFDMVRSGAKLKIESDLAWGGLPVTIKGETDSWEQLINNWGLKPTYFALDLNLGMNKQSAQVQGGIQFAPNSRPVVDLKVKSSVLDSQVLSATLAKGAKTAVAAKPHATNRVFSSQPLPFNRLPMWQGQVQVDVGALTLPNGLKLVSLNGVLTVTPDDAWSLKPLSFKIGSGQIIADGRLNAVHSARPGLEVRGAATGFDLGHVLTQLGKGDLVSGGPTHAAFNISSQGTSISALAANANGAVQISVGPATVSNSLTNLAGDFVVSVANAVNPLRLSSDSSQLQCLVAYLPVRNGLVQINQSIGMQTDRLDVTLDGQINLGSEALRINIQPKEKSGLTTGVNPAGLVQITGTLTNPSMGINKVGVVKQATGVGLAIVTGGISLLAQNAAGVVSRSSPCDNVLRPWPTVSGGLTATP